MKERIGEFRNRNVFEVLYNTDDGFILEVQRRLECGYMLPLRVDEDDKFDAENTLVEEGDVLELSDKQAIVWSEHRNVNAGKRILEYVR